MAPNLYRLGARHYPVRVTATVEDDAERAALELVEAVLTPDTSGERVSDELHARAPTHYDTKTLWLTMAIDQMRFIQPGAHRQVDPGKERHRSSNAPPGSGEDTQPDAGVVAAPAVCRHGYRWGPGRVVVGFMPCDCPAAAA